jgi:hypothetical protein
MGPRCGTIRGHGYPSVGRGAFGEGTTCGFALCDARTATGPAVEDAAGVARNCGGDMRDGAGRDALHCGAVVWEFNSRLSNGPLLGDGGLGALRSLAGHFPCGTAERKTTRPGRSRRGSAVNGSLEVRQV